MTKNNSVCGDLTHYLLKTEMNEIAIYARAASFDVQKISDQIRNCKISYLPKDGFCPMSLYMRIMDTPAAKNNGLNFKGCFTILIQVCIRY